MTTEFDFNSEEARAWAQFMSGALMQCMSAETAARVADSALAEYKKRLRPPVRQVPFAGGF